MHPMQSGDAKMSAPNENADVGRSKRLLQSPSLQSLRSFMAARRTQAITPPVAISQPTLAEASREKMRNKIRQSPSMLSIHARGAELATTYDREQLERLFAHTARRGPESELCTRPDRHYIEFLTARTPPEELLQTLQIHAQVAEMGAGAGAFAQILDVHMLPVPSGPETQYRCVFEMPCYGTRLSDMTFQTKHEPVLILKSLAEALARAEEALEFEHRNLHPGNVMVARDPETGSITGVTILDCSLARSHAQGAPILYTPLDHPAFYDAKTPVLSLMRKAVSDSAAFTPVTNVLWLTYLARFMYNVRPSSRLRALYDVLNPKWPLRRGSRSTREALGRIRSR